MQRRHYRCQDGTVNIDTPKSHKTRWAAVNESLVRDLRELVATLPDQSATGYVFVRCNRYTRNEPLPLTGAAATKRLRKIAKRAGLLDADGKHWVSPHMLRATGASLAVAAGVSPHIASQQLGHARVDTTQRHYLRLDTTPALKAFGQAFG